MNASPDSPGTPSARFFNWLKQLAASIGPGIFIVGYIVGTGSVTTMASSGADYGLALTWALALSCFCTYVMTVAISRVTILNEQTLLHSIHQKFGLGVAVFIILGLMLTVLTSVMGVMGIATDVVREWTRPLTSDGSGVNPVISTVFFTGILYCLFLTGSHPLFLKAMALIVGVMGICFVAAMLLVIPDPVAVVEGLVPQVPSGPGAHLILAGMVGTTMASVCLVTRSYLVAEKGWTLQDLATENRDAALSLTLTFIVSASIVAAAAGTMHVEGRRVENAIDMVRTLEPLAGRLATSIFVLGIVAAALSSLFPNYLLGPWTVCDILNVPRKMNRPSVRIAVLAVALTGFVVPIFEARPVILMIASQAVSPVVMPLLIILVMILLNDRKHADKYRNPLWMNVSLWITLGFSLFMSYAAMVGLVDFFRQISE